MPPVRLQKLLSEQGICSRRRAEELIRRGQVLLNGQRATIGQKVTTRDKVTVEGQTITGKRKVPVVVAFHKPIEVESTCKKIPGKKTLADYAFLSERIFPVGRLDKDSRGLLLFTNDGQLADTLMHPKYQHAKEYLVTVDKKLTPDILAQLRSPIDLGTGVTQPCRVRQVLPTVFSIILQEGMYRQIRRMCAHCGLGVLDLLRIRIENIHLGELPTGKHRVLSTAEVEALSPVSN